ncbi:sulfatase [Myxococcota bacterium]|nr:sulfatase [Myxococcota bacterium]
MSPWLLTTALAGCGWLRGPDVILLTVDTLRVDHVSAYAPGSPVQTPAMDALAADGVLYTQAWSPISVTGPAFATLMTGREPASHGVLMNVFQGGPSVREEEQTLAEHLRDQGWQTGAFISGFTLRTTLGLHQGFQRYDTPPPRQKRRSSDLTARAALGWLGQREWHQRAFVWWHSYDPHGPLDSQEGSAPRGGDWERDPARIEQLPAYQQLYSISDPDFYARRYAAAVSFSDAQVGRIVAALKEAGRYDGALIVLTADHGESFTERELWFDHGTHASPEQLHVPLIIKYPGGEGAGSRVDALVGLGDVAPTVLDALDLPPLPRAEGRPIRQGGRDHVFGESSHCKTEPVLTCAPKGPAGKELAVRDRARALVRRSTAEGAAWDGYDRGADPGERSPLPPGDPAWQGELEQAHAHRVAMAATGAQQEGAPVDPEELQALQALGYVDAEPAAAE